MGAEAVFELLKAIKLLSGEDWELPADEDNPYVQIEENSYNNTVGRTWEEEQRLLRQQMIASKKRKMAEQTRIMEENQRLLAEQERLQQDLHERQQQLRAAHEAAKKKKNVSFAPDIARQPDWQLEGRQQLRLPDLPKVCMCAGALKERE